MTKLSPIGDIPNTHLAWEKLEWYAAVTRGVVVRMTAYLLIQRQITGLRTKRKVLANLDLGQLVALRATIDAIVEAAAKEAEK